MSDQYNKKSQIKTPSIRQTYMDNDNKKLSLQLVVVEDPKTNENRIDNSKT